MLRISTITWRNRKTMNELSGGNLRRIYLTERIVDFVNDFTEPLVKVDITIDDVDSWFSKSLALGAKIIEDPLRGLAAMLRELRFHYVDCGLIRRITEDSALLIIDHVRSVVMLSKCRVRKPSVVILHDYHKEFPYGINSMTRIIGKFYDKLIYDYLNNANLIITASVRDAILYSERLNNDNILAYPNLYYPRRKVTINKSDKLIINLVSPKAPMKKIKDIIDILRSRLSVKIRGISAPSIPGIENLGTIPLRDEYLELLAQGHIGINITDSKFQPDSNVKRYDYAIAGNLPLNYMVNATGEPLPREYTFTDKYDLVAKIESLSLEEIVKYGMENAEYTYRKSIEYNEALKQRLHKLFNDLKI